MLYEERIEQNLMNNFIDRKEMVQIMLDIINSNLEDLIVQKLKLTSYGKELKYIFNEKDYFNFIAYYYLSYINQKSEETKQKFILEANKYLKTFSNVETILKFEKLGKDYKLKLYENGVLKN